MASHAIDIASLLKVFEEGESKGLLKREFVTINDTQKEFIDLYNTHKNEISTLQDFLVKVSRSADEINDFFAENGFTLTVQPLSPTEFAIATIYDKLFKWLSESEESHGKIHLGEGIDYVQVADGFSAFALLTAKDDKKGFTVFSAEGHLEPIAEIKTESGESIFITVADEEMENFNLFKKVQSLSSMPKQEETDVDYNKVIIPEVMMDEKPALDWLQDLANDQSIPDYFTVKEAVQQVKLAMNNEGAHIKSATAVSFERLGITIEDIPKKSLVIDRPFYLWVKNDKLDIPMIAFYIDTDSWKKADLNLV